MRGLFVRQSDRPSAGPSVRSDTNTIRYERGRTDLALPSWPLHCRRPPSSFRASRGPRGSERYVILWHALELEPLMMCCLGINVEETACACEQIHAQRSPGYHSAPKSNQAFLMVPRAGEGDLQRTEVGVCASVAPAPNRVTAARSFATRTRHK